MRRLPGIISVKASYRQGNAVVEYDPAQVTPAAMAEAIEAATYYQVGEPVLGTPASQAAGQEGGPQADSTAVIIVQGMTDDRAASQVLAAMGRPDAIADASVDLAAGTVTVQYDADRVSAETLVGAIDQSTPYRASLLSKSEAEDTEGTGGAAGANYVLWALVGFAVLVATGSLLAWGRTRWVHVEPSRAARRREKRAPRRR